MERDIHFTDKQGNEYFVMVRETKVEVWRNKEQIHDVRFYDDELTDFSTKTQGEFVNDGIQYQIYDYVLRPFNTDEGFTNIEVMDYDDNVVYEIAGVEMIKILPYGYSETRFYLDELEKEIIAYKNES